MDVKCDYCDGFFDDQLENCPNCGAMMDGWTCHSLPGYVNMIPVIVLFGFIYVKGERLHN